MDDYFKNKINKTIEDIRSEKSNTINLVKYRLGSIPKEILECKNAKHLLLNADTIIDEDSVGLSEEFWWEVSFDNNSIYQIPDEISKLSNLETININQNSVSHISPEIGKLNKLKELHLRNNSLNSIPKEIGMLENLEILDLSFNNLTEIPKEIYQLKKLKQLNLFANNLVSLPLGIEGLENLEELNIANFDSDDIDPETIERFSLTTNRFEILPPEIANLPKLKTFKTEYALSPELEEILSWGLNAYPYVVEDNKKLQLLLKKNNSSRDL